MSVSEQQQAIDDAITSIEWTLAALEQKLGAPVTDLRIERFEVTGLMSHAPSFRRRVVVDFGPIAGYGWESVNPKRG